MKEDTKQGVKIVGKSKEAAKTVDKSKQELDRPGKLMVSGIPTNKKFTDAELEKAFAVYGRITEVNVVLDKRTNLPRGFAFVTYENPLDAEDAIKAMEGKDFGGQTKVHCEQAVIGRKQTMKNTREQQPQGQGRSWGREGPGMGGADRTRGRSGGRGLYGPGVPSNRGRYQGGGMFYQEENFQEEYYEPEPAFRRFPSRGGPGGMPMRGGGQMDRGRPPMQGPVGHGNRRALLPDPYIANQRQEAEYGGQEFYEEPEDSYQEVYEEQYVEEEEYPQQQYMQEWAARPRGRGAVLPRGRGAAVLGVRGASQARARVIENAEDYEYAAEAPSQRNRALGGPAPAPRRGAAIYNQEVYEEDDGSGLGDAYGRSRGRTQFSAVGPAGRGGVTGNRLGAAPLRRAALLDAELYGEEENVYDRQMPQAAPAFQDEPEFEDDPYGDQFNGRLAGQSRAAAPARMRPSLLGNEVYGAARGRPKPGLLSANDPVGNRRAALAGASAQYGDDYPDSEPGLAPSRNMYGQDRRPPLRRNEADQFSYQSAPHGSGENISSDPYGRKRPLDTYGDALGGGGSHMPPSFDYEYEDYGMQPAVPPKSQRMDRDRQFF